MHFSAVQDIRIKNYSAPTSFLLKGSTVFFFDTATQAIHGWKALDLGSLDMQFQLDWPKDRKITAVLNFCPENLEKFRSTELYGAALEGSTIFLYTSSLGCTSMENCQLADLKYAFFSSTGSKTKQCVGWTTSAKHG